YICGPATNSLASVPQMPFACTRTSSSPARARGRGTRSIRTSRGPWYTAARIVRSVTASASRSAARVAGRMRAIVDGLREVLLGTPGPELRDVRIRLDHRVLQLAVAAFGAPDVDVLDRVPVRVEGHRTARDGAERRVLQRASERLGVRAVAADGRQRVVEQLRAGVRSFGVVRRLVAVRFRVRGDERVVRRRVERRAVLQRADDAHGRGTGLGERALVGGVALAQQRHLQTELAVLLDEVHRRDAREA